LADRPSSTGSFTDKRMIMALSLGAAAGAEANRAKTSAVHGEVESINTFCDKESKGGLGGVGIVGLHEDPTHARASPVGLEKTGERRVISSKAGRRGDGKLQFVPEMSEGRSPHIRRDGLAVVLAFKGTKRLDSDFEEGAVDVVEGKETDERTEGHTIRRKRPVVDEVELGLGRTVAIRSNVMADVFNPVSKEFALLQLESNTIFHKHVTHTLKQTKESSENGSPEQNVINDNTTAQVSSISWVARLVESFPLCLKNTHHTGIKRGCVTRPKRHDTKTILFIVRSKESELLLVTLTNHDLVIPSLVVEGDKEQSAGRVTEIVKGVVATRNGIFKREGDLVQATIRDTQAPDKICDVQDMFLMRLGSKNDGRAPRAKASANPTVGF
jgi:hypothetical protein